MTVNILPTHIPTVNPKRQRFRRPWQSDPSCVLNLMPEINTQWRDYSGHNNHATLVGPTRVHNGRFGEALLFDGVNDAATITHSAELSLPTEVTVECWTNASAMGGAGIRPILRKTSNVWAYNDYNYGLGIIDDGVTWVHGDGVGHDTLGVINILDGNWHHILGGFDAVNHHVIIDKVRTTAANTRVPLVNVNDLEISFNNAGNLFAGILDTIRIYNKMLTDSEISNLYEQGKPSEV